MTKEESKELAREMGLKWYAHGGKLLLVDDPAWRGKALAAVEKAMWETCVDLYQDNQELAAAAAGAQAVAFNLALADERIADLEDEIRRLNTHVDIAKQLLVDVDTQALLLSIAKELVLQERYVVSQGASLKQSRRENRKMKKLLHKVASAKSDLDKVVASVAQLRTDG